MHIKFSPQRRDDTYSATINNDIITIDGIDYDFSPLPEGATLPQSAVDCPWLASDVERINGEIHLTLLLPHGANAPESTRFPAPITVTTDGPIDLPIYDIEVTHE